MKGTFFNKPLEWNIETLGETWRQGDELKGSLRVKNHGTDAVELDEAGVSLILAEIRKVQSRAEGALKPTNKVSFTEKILFPGKEKELPFTFPIDANAAITDKKASFYLCYGTHFVEAQLQVKVEPKELFQKVSGLLDTFHRFKLKECKANKKGVEFKFQPPTSREMANIESLFVTYFMDKDNLGMRFEFHVKKLDTSSATTKLNKETVSVERLLPSKDYSLGKGMINQDKLLKTLEEVLSEVKMKAVF
jgi:hypothetical protein